ncbi:unnamed protein product [Diabrotica balteata]|uniref:Uncharacterized protein n=1 Tax=Diabrotica balteata TaxID=107213 RepID=A0A9N9T5W2_DIABA|nr:unnamed protein product [Diabrotica balteata]
MNLPSARGTSGLSIRQRPIPSRGGQLQVAGVVVGSWGANYGYQGGVRQMVPSGYTQRGRGRGGGNSSGGASAGGYQSSYGRGRGTNRRPGMPTFLTNNRKNQGNKKRNTNKPNKGQKPQGVALTVKTDGGDVPVTDVVIDEGGNTCAEEKKKNNTNTCAGEKKKNSTNTNDHKGQDDVPCKAEAVATASN